MKSYNYKKIVVIFIIPVFFTMLLISCNENNKIATPDRFTDKKITNNEVIRDSIFKIQPDTSSLKALIEWTKGKAVIKEIIQSESGKNHLKFPKIQIKDNILTVDCETRAQELVATWKEHHTKEFKTETITHTEFKNLSRWESFCLGTGKIVTLLFISTFIIYLLRKGIKK